MNGSFKVLFVALELVSGAKPSAGARVQGIVRSQSGDPLPGVEIAVDLAPLTFRSRSDRAGRFDLNLVGDAHALVFDRAGYCRKHVDVGAGAEVLSVALDACPDVHVQVRDGQDRPIEGLPIRYERADGRSAAGSVVGARIVGVEPGRIRITVAGRPDVPEKLADVGSRNTSVVMKVAGSGRLQIRVVDTEGRDVTSLFRASLLRGEVASPVTEAKWAQLEPDLLWPEEKNRFSGLAAGTYTVLVAGAPGAPITVARVALGENAHKTVTVRLPANYRERP